MIIIYIYDLQGQLPALPFVQFIRGEGILCTGILFAIFVDKCSTVVVVEWHITIDEQVQLLLGIV